MPPKAQRKSPSRSKSPKKGESLDTGFVNSLISDDTWQAIVAFVVPSKVHDELYIEQLEKATKSGCRRRFTWITKKDLIDQVIEQTSGKQAKKTGTAQNIDRMTPGLLVQIEAAKPYVDNKEEIPENILIKILKSKLVHIRNIEIERKANQSAGGDKKGGVVKKDKSPSGKKTPVKNKKGGAGPLPDIDKQSQLKKKEEIEDEEKFIDDEPTDGPDHYFIISGFNNPAIFTNCEELNLYIDCIIKFKSKGYRRIKEFYKEIDDRERLETNLKSNLKIIADEATKDKPIDVEALSEERQAQMKKTANELENFWRDINMVLENSNDKSILQNIARLKYTVDKDPEIKSWFELEPRGEFALKMFGNVSEKLYELVIQKRQYKNYIKNLKLFSVPICLPLFSATQVNLLSQNQNNGQQSQTNVHVPVETTNDQSQPQPQNTNIEFDKASTYDIRLYNELLDAIPPEYISTELVLHCLVEQVVSNDDKSSNERTSTNISRMQNLNTDISQHFSDLIMNLPLSIKEKEAVLQFLPVTKKEIKVNQEHYPYLINHHDEISARLKTVTGSKNENNGKFVEDKNDKKFPFDLLNTEYSILEKSPLTLFTGLPDVPKQLSKERAARLQELLHFCTSPEITYAEADRAFKQFIFESMSLTETDENGQIIINNDYTVIPWDDPYPNINSTLSEEKQLQLKTMSHAESRPISPHTKRKLGGASSAGTSSVRSIKFQDEMNGANQSENKENSWGGPSSILKSRPSTKLSGKIVQSVHFDEMDDLENQLDISPRKSVEQVLELIRSSRQRNLNEWYFAEHFEPKVLVQILKEAVYTHPFINTYYNKRDHSIMIVLSNPYSEKTLSNYQQSTIKLHSNVGFRNYLEKIYDMIIEWTRDEEAKYQALLTTKEVQSFLLEQQKQQDNRSRPSSKSTKDRPGSTSDKSKKKSKVDTPAVASDEPYITNAYVASDSLKAWKKEHDKQVVEQQQRKIKSPKSKASADTNKKDGGKKDTKSPTRTGKSQSRSVSPKTRSPAREASPGKAKKTTRSDSKSKSDEDTVEYILNKKEDNSFVGYDIGNNMVYIKTFLNHMFPCDGSLIKTEKIELKTVPKTLVTTSVIKHGNVFSLHLVDPKKEKLEALRQSDQEFLDPHAVHGTIKNAKDEVALAEEHKHIHPNKDFTNKSIRESIVGSEQINEGNLQNSPSVTSMKVSDDNSNNFVAKYGCFTGSFKDGFNVSYSIYDIKPSIKIDTAIQVITPTQEQLNPIPPIDDKQAKKVDKKKGKKDPTPEPVEEIHEVPVVIQLEVKEPPKFKILPWSQLFLSTPTGLSCTFLPETYSGVPAIADNEPHRLLVKQYYSAKCNINTAETAPNAHMNIYKEKTRIFKSDGTVIKMMNDESIEILYPNGTIYRKESNSKDASLEDPELEAPIKEKKGRKKAEQKGEETPREKPKPKSIFITPSGNKYEIKADKTFELLGYNRNIVAHDPQSGETLNTREDGVKIVTRPDGSSVVDYADGTRITTFYMQKTLKVNDNETGETSTEQKFKLGKYYKIECHGFATTIFNADTTDCTIVFGNGTYVSCNPEKSSYVVSHCGGEKLEIDSKGVTAFCPRVFYIGEDKEAPSNRFFFYQNADTILDHVDEDGNIFKVDKYGKCTSIPVENNGSSASNHSIIDYSNHSPRFFIIHKDSSGTELLRFQDIHEYMKDADLDPMVAIMRDPVQGHPNVMGTTVLKPLKDSLYDNWINEYDEKDITPYGLRCRDLLSFPPNPEIKTSGPKFSTKLGKSLDIKKEQSEIIKNPPLLIPRRMEYRQIIEYEKLSDETRNMLIQGLRNYIIYVAERAEKHRILLTHDPRSETEKLTAYKILHLARPDQLFDEDIIKLYGKKLKAINEKENDIAIKSMKKSVQRRKPNTYENLLLEINREKINKQAWKKAFVPPYFESIWGKHFLEKEKEKHENPEMQQENLNQQVNAHISVDGKDNKKFIGQTFEDPDFKRRSPLPPITKTNVSSTDKNDNALMQNFTFYQTKDVERLEELRVPNSIKTTRAYAVPNAKFWTIEDPVRRKTKNLSVKASIINGKPLERRRGCEVYPNQIRFGLLKEGCTYAYDLELVNVGIDICRFKIKQFAPESGLSIVYKPGPIAPGMVKEITIIINSIFNKANDTIEQISPSVVQLKYELEITTETDIILVPIEADIATVDEYHKMFRGNLEAGKTPKTRIMSVNPINSSPPVIRLSNSLNNE